MARRLLLLLAAFTALALTSLAGIAVAASTGSGPQNRVGAQNPVGQAGAGLTALESSCTHPGSAATSARIASGFCVAAEDVPSRLARVMETRVANRATSLGAPGEADVFVTPAGELDGLSSSQIADRLTLQNADGSLRSGPFSVFEFDTPEGVASPVFRDNPGFVPGGATGGGASEYVVPNLNFEDLGNLTRTDAP